MQARGASSASTCPAGHRRAGRSASRTAPSAGLVDRGRRGRAPTTASSPTWIRCAPTGSSSAARSASATRARISSRPARASCSISGSNRRYDHLLHHDFVFSRDPGGGVRLHLPQAASRRPTRPATSRRPPRPTRSVAPAGGEALYVLVHTPYLRPHHDWSRMLPAYRRTILDKLKRTAGLADIEEPDRRRAAPDAAGHPRPLPGAERRHLRARQPRPLHRRLQAGQPLARGARPLPRGRRGPSGARACRW